LILFVLTFFHLSLFHVSSTVAYNVIYNNGLIFSNQPANWIGRAVSNELKVTFATGNHSAEPLMLFAIGPCSEAFIGFLDNTYLLQNRNGQNCKEKSPMLQLRIPQYCNN
jgi:hypothetical protein